MKRRVLPTGLLSACIVPILLFGCDQSDLGTGGNPQPAISVAGINRPVLQQNDRGEDPRQLFEMFKKMVSEVKQMEREEIVDLGEQEVLEIGAPIAEAVNGTVMYSAATLENLAEILTELLDNRGTLTKSEHEQLSERAKRVLAAEPNPATRNVQAEDIRGYLLEFQQEQETFAQTCEDLFNVQFGEVLLAQGDNFEIANFTCPPGSDYILLSATHTNQTVSHSKNTNSWTGFSEAVMDGQGNQDAAFDSGLQNNILSYFKIENYNEYGITSGVGSQQVEVHHLEFENIAPSKEGESHGAVVFNNCEDIDVSDSYFEDVAAGVLLTNCDGPLTVTGNEAMNPGRNFFQCDKCHGAGIRVNDNSMDHTTGYGNAVLEDWISIYDSEGTSGDYIQVNHNRARGHSGSGSGSFVMLGDHGGKYQEAVDNIGVNPGQVGIGAHGGEHIYVSNNKMFSKAWFDNNTESGSNVGFSSYNSTSSFACADHVFENNTANWTCGDSAHCSNPPSVNNAWADGSCNLLTSQMGVSSDGNMDENVWFEW